MTNEVSRQRGRGSARIPAWHGVLLTAAALIAAGCVTDMTDSTIFGTATFRERTLLQPGSTLEVSVIEASRADAPSDVIASRTFEDLGPPPYYFVITIHPNKVDERLSYFVRATIRNGDTMLMTTDTAYPVLTQGAGNEIDLVLHGGATQAAASTSSLSDTLVGILACADCAQIE